MCARLHVDIPVCVQLKCGTLPSLQGCVQVHAYFCEVRSQYKLLSVAQGSRMPYDNQPHVSRGVGLTAVMCCRQFPRRRLKVDGAEPQPVLAHSELVQYLMQKSEGSKAYLAFEGMNQVVYRMQLTVRLRMLQQIV